MKLWYLFLRIIFTHQSERFFTFIRGRLKLIPQMPPWTTFPTYKVAPRSTPNMRFQSILKNLLNSRTFENCKNIYQYKLLVTYDESFELKVISYTLPWTIFATQKRPKWYFLITYTNLVLYYFH